MLPYGLRLYGMKSVTLSSTFARFGEILRMQVEYRTLRGTQGYVLRLYKLALRPIPYMRATRPRVPRNVRYSTCTRTISPKRANVPKKRNTFHSIHA